MPMQTALLLHLSKSTTTRMARTLLRSDRSVLSCGQRLGQLDDTAGYRAVGDDVDHLVALRENVTGELQLRDRVGRPDGSGHASGREGGAGGHRRGTRQIHGLGDL